MEILISMKPEGNKSHIFDNPYMNSACSNTEQYFIAEIRDSDNHKIELLQKYANILLDKFYEAGNYSVENTQLGFRLKRKVNTNNNYTEEWDGWVKFSTLLHKELETFFEKEAI